MAAGPPWASLLEVFRMARKKLGWTSAAAVAALAVGLVFLGATAEAQKTKGKSRQAQTKYLMRGVNQTHCAGIAGLLKGKGPADDKAWDTLTCHASVLNEMSYTLMDDGRCPDKDWAAAAKALRESSAKVLEAAKEKKLSDAQEAFKGVTGACAACHKAHRPK
jgi:cytochrome c556